MLGRRRKGLSEEETLVYQEIGKTKDQGMRAINTTNSLLTHSLRIPALVHAMCWSRLVAQVATAGIWTKDLRRRTGLATNVVTKALKVLEQRELVKSVKSVQHGNRKQYMLFHLEPSEHVTGGVW